MRFKIKRLGNDFDIKHNRRFLIGIVSCYINGTFYYYGADLHHPLSRCFVKLDNTIVVTSDYYSSLKIFTSLLILE